MKRIIFFLAAAMVALFVSCNKNEDMNSVQQAGEAVVNINLAGLGEDIVPATKATGSTHGVQADDNTVGKAEIFIFDAAGNLEKYGSYTTSTGISMKATVGAKNIYVLVNNHDVTVTGVTTLSKFKALITSLKKEALKSFTMIGSKSVTLQTSNTIEMPVARLCSRVIIKSVKLDLSGTLYKGTSLTDVKMYLINAHASKLVWNGAEASTPVVLNKLKYISGDNSGLGIANMLGDVASGTSIADGATHSTKHYFYTYPYAGTTQTDTDKFTAFVIEATVGTAGTRYWRIDINRQNYGYVTGTTAGLEANKSYEYDVVLKNIGSDKIYPDSPATVDVDLTVADWVTVTNGTQTFDD